MPCPVCKNVGAMAAIFVYDEEGRRNARPALALLWSSHSCRMHLQPTGMRKKRNLESLDAYARRLISGILRARTTTLVSSYFGQDGILTWAEYENDNRIASLATAFIRVASRLHAYAGRCRLRGTGRQAQLSHSVVFVYRYRRHVTCQPINARRVRKAGQYHCPLGASESQMWCDKCHGWVVGGWARERYLDACFPASTHASMPPASAVVLGACPLIPPASIPLFTYQFTRSLTWINDATAR